MKLEKHSSSSFGTNGISKVLPSHSTRHIDQKTLIKTQTEKLLGKKKTKDNDFIHENTPGESEQHTAAD